MKKILFLLFIWLCVSALFASQETYGADSEEVKLFKYLRMQAGTVTPEPTMPVSGSQLLELLEKINVSKLGSEDKTRYLILAEKLSNAYSDVILVYDGYGAIDIDGEVSPFGSVRLPGAEIEREQLLYDYHNIPPLLSLRTTAWGNDFIAGKLVLEFNKSFFTDAMLNSTAFLSNFTGIYEWTMPYVAWVSIGKGVMNLSLGRDKVSSGNGYSGNLSIGSNFLYQNFAKVSYINPKFSYDFTLMEFDSNLSGSEYSDHEKALVCIYPDFNSENPVIANHRISFRLSDKFAVSVFEGMLEYTNTAFNIKFLNPLMILHNYNSFFANNNNNYCGVECEAALPKEHDCTCQIFIDQYQFSFEKEAAKKAPNAYGILLNVSKGVSFADFFGNVYFETVYTSPCLYLKAKDYFEEDSQYPYYVSDLVVGYRYSKFTDTEYVGYKYGPDSIVMSLGTSLIGSKCSFSGDLTYRIHGVYRIGDSILENFRGNVTPYLTEGKVAEHDITLKLDGEVEISKSISVSGAVGLLCSFNYENTLGKTLFDTQTTLGIKIKPQNFSF